MTSLSLNGCYSFCQHQLNDAETRYITIVTSCLHNIRSVLVSWSMVMVIFQQFDAVFGEA